MLRGLNTHMCIDMSFGSADAAERASKHVFGRNTCGLSARPLLRRYDKLVGMFSGKDVPAVGISIGIERVFKILQVRV